MKNIRWACDKCGVAIVAGRVTIEVTTGPERLRRPEIDLCGECSTRLWEWLDTPPPAAEASPGRADPTDQCSLIGVSGAKNPPGEY